ncbi:protein disulfide-isomerase TMX3-like [Etheostoma cragini]|uniref:protein disulfide-isomerase TMX3-like n=1 Tax=Etheostoma cragini TaxID=417921 RepID=UPI00155E7C84|nr:protein disulfide-isomerase TMX3-like [Etheostoma cragini]
MLDRSNTLLLSGTSHTRLHSCLYLFCSGSVFLFFSFLKTKGDDEIWLIEFYAPWCPVCEQLDPVWHQIGSELRSLGSPVHVGKSDATASKDLSKEFKILSFPAIVMLKKDMKYIYSGPKTKDEIMEFANRVSGPLVRHLSSVQLFQHVRTRHDVMIVYVGATSPLKGNFTSVAETLIVHTFFFSAPRDVLPKEVSLPSLPAVVIFKDGTYFTFNEEHDGDLQSWINRERFPNYNQIDGYTLYAMGESGKLVVLVVAEEKSLSQESLRYKSLVEKVSADYREIYSRNFYFGFMKGSEYIDGLVMGELSVPSFIVVNLSNDGFFMPLGAVQTERHLLDFLNGVLDGSIQGQGGNSIDLRAQRLLYNIKATVKPVFVRAPLYACFLLSLPLLVMVVLFRLCRKKLPPSADADGDGALLDPSLRRRRKPMDKKSD